MTLVTRAAAASRLAFSTAATRSVRLDLGIYRVATGLNVVRCAASSFQFSEDNMIGIRSFATAALPLLGIALVSPAAKALTVPDTGTCSGTTCLRINATSSSSNSIALYGDANGGTGVFGAGSAHGVWGYTAFGIGVRGQGDGNVVGVQGESTSNNGVRGYTSSATAAAISALSPSSTGLAFYGGGGILISGNAWKPGGGQWTASSDARIKKDVKDLRWGIEELRQVRTVTFKYNGLGDSEDNGREYTGVVAQELEKIFPSMVSSRKAKLNKSDSADTDIKQVDPSAFTYVLINAVKEQQQIIERQEKRISALERGRGPLGASILGGGLGTGIALGLLPLAFLALNRRKKATT
jgi:hypothetical protein